MPYIIDAAGLADLLAVLAENHRLIGPRAEDGVIRYAPITSIEDLPAGWTDEHGGGHYRLQPRSDQAYFGYVNGPDSAKTYLFPARAPMWTYTDGNFVAAPDKGAPTAIVGLRACDLAAIAIQDEVLLNGPYPDSHYAGQRSEFFVVAVNCTTYGATCFCTSMGTGPRAESGFDLGLTEVLSEDDHFFLVEVGTDAGRELLAALEPAEATSAQCSAGDDAVDATARGITKALDTTDITAFLASNLEHPRWSDVAGRCLACTNCTAVCPTCFCTTPVDTSSFDGTATRERIWDSCFSLEYSFMGGHPVRQSGAGRYRQWMTHKLGTWIEQFGTSGCVGCGRCITWCPVGIDITEEMAAMRAGAGVT